jgi:hypothetical protein
MWSYALGATALLPPALLAVVLAQTGETPGVSWPNAFVNLGILGVMFVMMGFDVIDWSRSRKRCEKEVELLRADLVAARLEIRQLQDVAFKDTAPLLTRAIDALSSMHKGTA